MNIRIRPAVPGDWPVIQKLNDEVFQDNAVYDAYLNLHWPMSKQGAEYYKVALKKSENMCFIAEDDSGAVGYILGGPKSEDYRTVKTAEINNMGVSPSSRSQGIGALLIEKFRQWAKDSGYQTLIVNAYSANQKAIGFYEKQGFAPVDISLEMKV